MTRVVPGIGDVVKFSHTSGNHNQSCDCSCESDCGLSHCLIGDEGTFGRVDSRRVVCGVEPEDGDVEDPDSIEVDQKMEERPSFVVGFEKGSVPVDFIKLHVPLRWWEVDQSRLVR